MTSETQQKSPTRDGVISIGSPSPSPSPSPANHKRSRDQSDDDDGEDEEKHVRSRSASESEASPSSRTKAIGNPKKRRKKMRSRRARGLESSDDEEEEGEVFEPRVVGRQSVPVETGSGEMRGARSQSVPVQTQDTKRTTRSQSKPADTRTVEQKLAEEKEWTVVEDKVKSGNMILDLPDLPAEPTDGDFAYWCERFYDLNKGKSAKKMKPALLCQALDKRVSHNVREGITPKSVNPRAHYFKRKWLFGSTAGGMEGILRSMRATYEKIKSSTVDGEKHSGALFDAQTNKSWFLPEELPHCKVYDTERLTPWVHAFVRLNRTQWDGIDGPLVARTLQRQEVDVEVGGRGKGAKEAKGRKEEREEGIREGVQQLFDGGRWEGIVREAKEANPRGPEEMPRDEAVQKPEVTANKASRKSSEEKVTEKPQDKVEEEPKEVPQEPKKPERKPSWTAINAADVATKKAAVEKDATTKSGSTAENFIAISSGSEDDDTSEEEDDYEPALEPGEAMETDEASGPNRSAADQQKRYFPSATDSANMCLLCGRSGHTSPSCTHNQPIEPRVRCEKCRQIGHQKDACTEKLALTKEEGLACSICQDGSHLEHECTRVWRSYHPEEEEGEQARRKVMGLMPSCALCGSEVHYASDCKEAEARGLPRNPTWSTRTLDLYIDPESENRGIEDAFLEKKGGRSINSIREPAKMKKATHVEYESEEDSDTEFLGRHPVRKDSVGARAVGRIQMASNIQMPGRRDRERGGHNARGGLQPLPEIVMGGGKEPVRGPRPGMARGRGGFSLPKRPPVPVGGNRFGAVPPPAGFGGGGGGSRRGSGGGGGGRGGRGRGGGGKGRGR